MKRILIIAGILLSLPWLTDKAVDAQTQGYTSDQVKAMDSFVAFQVTQADPVVTTGRCGEDWVCLIAWAEEQHPTKHKRRKL